MDIKILEVNNGYIVHDSCNNTYVFNSIEHIKLLEFIGKLLLGKKVKIEVQ